MDIRQRLRLTAILIGSFVLVVVVWRWTAYRSSSNFPFDWYVAAVRRGDAPALSALTLDVEKRDYGVTPALIQRFFQRVAGTHAAQLRWEISNGDDGGLEFADRWHRREVVWVDGATGRPLPSARSDGQLKTTVDLFQGPDGRWQVSFTRLVMSYVRMDVINPRIEREGLAGPQFARELEKAAAMMADLGVPRYLPDPPLARVHGRFVVAGDGGAEGRIQ